MAANTAPLIIFDFDGVVVDSEIISLSELQIALRRFGFDVGLSEVRERFLGVSRFTIEAFIDEHGKGASSDGFSDLWYEALFKRFRSDLVVVDGLIQTLDALDDSAIPHCIASSSSFERLGVSLEAVGLSARLAGRVFSAELVENGKPAPDLFLYAARAMGAEPENSVVIEDSPAGIIGACRAGMKPVGFVGGSHLTDCKDQHTQKLFRAGAEFATDDLIKVRQLVNLTDAIDRAAVARRN